MIALSKNFNIFILKALLVLFCFSFKCVPYSLASENQNLKHIDWSFNGINGKFDRQSIQRGFKVYREVCAACHSLHYLAFRNLSNLGFNEEQVKAIAAEYSVQDGPNDEGAMYMRAARPSDHIPAPYANEKEARASNNGALPPDLSLIIKARENGPDYIYSLLTGFIKAPDGFIVGENMYYNPYFVAGDGQIAMPPPLLKEGQVEYDDGTKATIEQMSKDVVDFLQWVAEPEMEDRKRLGMQAIVFISILTLLLYAAMKRIWRNIK